MKSYVSFVLAALSCVLLATQVPQVAAEHEYSPLMQKLLTYDQATLDSVYANAKPGDIPDGKSYGLAFFDPNRTSVNKEVAKIAEYVWQGKTFTRHNETYATLVNRVFHIPMISADVYFGKSWFDGGESIILDYARLNPDVFGTIRDEIRQIGESQYLGRVYLTIEDDPFVLNFGELLHFLHTYTHIRACCRLY
eukprot:TRINITY_DN1418_c0_g1_i3.p1 TRINITY_DN1418_c0_g1~~TRINITY_DN1418_c0_g1_i3.p1  ORF type:complete len:228 (-),score=45.33 TRINITY_DN1418_c0_g1_i3:625-1206(-)